MMDTNSRRTRPSMLASGIFVCGLVLLVSYPKSLEIPFSQQQHRQLEPAISNEEGMELLGDPAALEESGVHTIVAEIDEHDELEGSDSTENVDISDIQDFDPALIEAMAEKLAPRELRMDEASNTTLAVHQFLHLHHMKTGGTSMDQLIRCSMERLKGIGYTVPYQNIHECSPHMYEKCVDGSDTLCRKRIADASVMSYCAPLKDLRDPFGWAVEDGTGALTVFRHPVARAWSMYRFQTRRCYDCKPLKEVYAEIDNGTSQIEDICKAQLMNHQTRNVLSKEGTEMEDEELKVEEAIANMKRFFTMVGLTEDMNTTRTMAGRVFPWLAEQYEGSDATCSLGRYNSSPQNNRCGPNNSHLPLPDVPDEETARIILEHNQLDMQVYEAAVEQFQLQKVALGL